jgi:hypothetical protein
MEENAMPNDPRPDDIRSVWQSQKEERSNMSLELIRYKAKKLEGTIRQQVMGIYFCVLLIVAACVFISWRIDQIFVRIGAGILVLWALSLAYQARKGVWPVRLAPDATLRVSLDFYRQELERQRSYIRTTGQMLWPILLSTALFVTPAVRVRLETLVKMAPFLMMMTAWAVALIVIAKQKLRAVQRELDEIDAVDKEAK